MPNTKLLPTDAMICDDCGWKGSTADWLKGCKGFPCELKAASTIPNTVLQDDGLVEHLKADIAGALVINSKRIRAFLRIDDAQAALAALETKERQLRMAVEALTAIESQAVCYGMKADETELRDWLEYICGKSGKALSAIKGTGR